MPKRWNNTGTARVMQTDALRHGRMAKRSVHLTSGGNIKHGDIIDTTTVRSRKKGLTMDEAVAEFSKPHVAEKPKVHPKFQLIHTDSGGAVEQKVYTGEITEAHKDWLVMRLSQNPRLRVTVKR